MGFAIMLLLLAAVASRWLRGKTGRYLPALLAVAATLLTIAAGQAPLTALLWLGLLALFTIGVRASDGHPVAWVLFIALALALGFGVVPGFERITVMVGSLKPPAPYALDFRLEKGLVGVALLYLVPLARRRAEWVSAGRVAAAAAGLTVPLVLATGWLNGFVQFAPGVGGATILGLWAAKNLLLVCAVEEAFFRGVLQRGLTRLLTAAPAIAIAAILSGLAHFGGGAIYVGLATLAGVGYGWAYHRGGLEAAMLTHFALNSVHLALFSYPHA